MQNDEYIAEMISKTLRDTPPAPEGLRRNVMTAIRERKPARRQKMRHVYALASVAIMLVAALGAYIIKDNLPKFASSDNNAQENMTYSAFSGGGAIESEEELQFAPAYDDAGEAEMFSDTETADDTERMTAAPNEAPAAESTQTNIKAHAELYENALVIRGDLPETLVGQSFTELEEGVYEFDEVTQEAAQKLVNAGAEGEMIVSDEGYVRVLWIPEHREIDE